MNKGCGMPYRGGKASEECPKLMAVAVDDAGWHGLGARCGERKFRTLPWVVWERCLDSGVQQRESFTVIYVCKIMNIQVITLP